MKNFLFLLVIVMLGIVSTGMAQDRKETRHFSKLDIGLNVTSVISSFSGNGNFLEAEDLPFLLRYRTKKSCFRLAAGLSGESTDFFDVVTGAFRESIANNYFGRIGLEYDLLSEGKWDMYIGLDLVGSLVQDEVRISSFSAQNTISQNTLGFGLSPFAGVKFYLGSRVYLGTEANFIFLFQNTTATESDAFTGERLVVDTASEQFSLNPPLFLYINYKL